MPRPRRVLFATDRPDVGAGAFAHAVRIAAARPGGALDVLLAGPDVRDPREDLERLPPVRATLRRWGHDAHLVVEKTVLRTDDPVSAIVDRAAAARADLVVVPSASALASALAARLPVPLLVVPPGSGFVDLATGAPTLRRALVAGDARTSALDALGLALAAAVATVRHAAVGAAAARAAPGAQADLLVVAGGPVEGFLASVLGTDAQRALAAASCAVLVVPASRAHALLVA